MQIEIPYTYRTTVLPLRARKPREEIFSCPAPLRYDMPEFTSAQTPLAFRVHIKRGFGAERTSDAIEIRMLPDGGLWKPALKNWAGVKPPLLVEDFPDLAKTHLNMPNWRWEGSGSKGHAVTRFPVLDPSQYQNVDSEGERKTLQGIRDYLTQFVVVDGVVHTQTTEPRYVVHLLDSMGGRRWCFIQSTPSYDHRDTPLDRYFRADDFAGALAKLQRFLDEGYKADPPEPTIDVLIPEAVRLDPRADERAARDQADATKIAEIDAELAELAQRATNLRRERDELADGGAA